MAMQELNLAEINAVTGALALLVLAEIVLAQNVFVCHPVVVLAVFSIALILWYWG